MHGCFRLSPYTDMRQSNSPGTLAQSVAAIARDPSAYGTAFGASTALILHSTYGGGFCWANDYAGEAAMWSWGGDSGTGDGYSYCYDGELTSRRFHVYLCQNAAG